MYFTLEWWKYALLLVLILGQWWVISFCLWKRFKSDHDNDDLIATGIYTGLFTISFSIAGFVLGHFLMGFLVGIIFGLVISAIKMGICFWDFGDDLYIWLIVCLLPYFIFIHDWKRLVGMLIILVLTGFIKMQYRSFLWYKSRKSGLALTAVIFTISLLEIVVAFVEGRGLYFAGIAGLIVGIVLFCFRLKNTNIKFSKWIKIKRRKSMAN